MMTRSAIRGTIPSKTALGQEAPSSSWWETTKEVLQTGAEIFEIVYPAIKGTSYPSPYPQYPGGYQIPTLPRTTVQQAGMVSTTPNWVLPVIAGVGGIMLITMMGKRR